ncbi:MAG: ParB N-terminal domain-containing protein [Pseudomonadota bacterium]
MSRKRLGRVDPDDVRTAQELAGQRPKRGAVPIAQMAAGVGHSIDVEMQRLRDENRDLAEKGALYDTAESEGRVVRSIVLGEIDALHIPRDRRVLDRDGEEWSALKVSLLSRGQQVPIEVVDLGSDASPRYGLVTGFRRLTALGELHAETGLAQFARVLAFIRPAISEPDKLVAMVEENEIRSGLSFYERGRIASLAAEAGMFESVEAAIAALFVTSNRNRRYKIRCFVTVYQALEGMLLYPDAIGERLGIGLAKSLRKGHGGVLVSALADWEQSLSAPPTESEELGLLSDFVARRGPFAEEQARTENRMADPAIPVHSASWDGTDGQRVTARLECGKVIVEIEGLSDVDGAALSLLTSWLGERMATG